MNVTENKGVTGIRLSSRYIVVTAVTEITFVTGFRRSRTTLCIIFLDIYMQVIGTNFTYMIVMTIHCHSLLCYRRSKHTVVAYKEAIYVFGGDNGYDTIMKKELLLCVQQLRVACFICLLLYSKL